MACPRMSSPGLSGLLECKKTKLTWKMNGKSSDTEENSFQASEKIYESDNDVMGILRIKHTSPVPNVHERLHMVRIC